MRLNLGQLELHSSRGGRSKVGLGLPGSPAAQLCSAWSAAPSGRSESPLCMLTYLYLLSRAPAHQRTHKGTEGPIRVTGPSAETSETAAT